MFRCSGHLAEHALLPPQGGTLSCPTPDVRPGSHPASVGGVCVPFVLSGALCFALEAHGVRVAKCSACFAGFIVITYITGHHTARVKAGSVLRDVRWMRHRRACCCQSHSSSSQSSDSHGIVSSRTHAAQRASAMYGHSYLGRCFPHTPCEKVSQ